MATETEAKIRITDVAAAERAIAASGARYTGDWVEIDAFFDHPDERLLKNDSALRMRIFKPLDTAAQRVCLPARLTYKGPRKPGRLKVRQECEVDVPEPDRMRELLAGLRYTQAFRYEKRRRRWEIDDAEITLDEVPLLGAFMEVEGRDDAHVEELLNRLGYADAPRITDGYVQLLYRELGSLAGRSLRLDGSM